MAYCMMKFLKANGKEKKQVEVQKVPQVTIKGKELQDSKVQENMLHQRTHKVANYRSLTVEALKELLRARDLHTSGLKADLIKRLVEADYQEAMKVECDT